MILKLPLKRDVYPALEILSHGFCMSPKPLTSDGGGEFAPFSFHFVDGNFENSGERLRVVIADFLSDPG